MEREEHVNTSVLASGPAVASEAPAEGMDDPFADDCLLPNAYLTADLQDVSEALNDPMGKLTPEEAGRALHGREQEGLLQYDWDNPEHGLRNSSEPSWNANCSKGGADLMDTLATDKGRAETGDSSEWEQTREQLSSMPLLKHTDSPESVLMGGTSQGAAHKEEQKPGMGGVLGSEGAFSHSEAFQHSRGGGGHHGGSDGLRVSTSQPQYGRMQGYPSTADGDHVDPITWERRGGSAAGPAYFASLLEPDHHHRGFWGDAPSGHSAGMDRGAARSSGTRGESTIYRMRSDMAQHMYSERFMPPRRQYSAELAYEMGHGRGMDYLPGSVEGPYEHPAAYGAVPMGDGYWRPVRRGMAPPGPSFYTPRLSPAGEAPVEGSRKRTREAYLQQSDFGGPQDRATMGGHRTGRLPGLGQGRLSHEHRLIETLKRQIAMLDSPTRGMLKESLYRISRNTNARVNGADGGQARSSVRNSYLDRVVANLMYNRFEPHPRPRMRPSSGGGGGGGWGMEPMSGPGGMRGPNGGGSPGMGMTGSKLESGT